jgi:hypothetical protein
MKDGIVGGQAQPWLLVVVVVLCVATSARAVPPMDDADAAWLAGLPDALAPVARPFALPLPPLRGGGTIARLEVLAQIAHRVAQRHGFPESEAWRVLGAWSTRSGPSLLMFDEPRIDGVDRRVEAYPVPLGRHEPRVDFAASFALAHVEPQRFACQFPLRFRFLAAQGLVAGAERVDVRRCRDVRAWLDPDAVEAFELIYVSQRWQDAAASMGHVLLRLRLKRSGGDVGGDQTDPTVAWVAQDPPETPHYLLKGLTGGLSAGPKFDMWGDVRTRYLLQEGRDAHHYELQMTGDERRWFIAELAAQRARPASIAYAFFTENCATMAWKVLRSALPELPEHAGWLFHPHELASELLKAGRARHLGPSKARKGRGIAAEAARSAIEEQLRASGWAPREASDALSRMFGEPHERAEALAALKRAFERWWPDGRFAADDAERRALWLNWVDTTLDVEAFAIDTQHGRVAGHLTSEPFEAALALRATLVEASPPPAPPRPTGTVRASGSRRAHIMTGAWAERGRSRAVRGLLRWQAGVLDEDVGEPRQAAFRRSSRMRLLVNALTFSSDGADLALEEQRLTVLETSDYAPGFRTNASWLATRIGWNFALESFSRPRQGLDFGLVLRGGPALRLWGDADLVNHGLLKVELEANALVDRKRDGDFARAVGRVGFDIVTALGAPEHRWRLTAMIGAAAMPSGLGLEASLATGIDWVLDRTSGLTLRLEAAWRLGFVRGDGWESLVGIVW